MVGACTIRLLGGFGAEVDGHAVPPQAWRSRRKQGPGEAPGARPWPPTAPGTGHGGVLARPHPGGGSRQPPQGRPFLTPGARLAASLGGEAEMVVLWPAGEVVTDVERFEAAARVARQSRRPEDCAAAAAVYRGELLPEDRYASWTWHVSAFASCT